jgi:bifunctional polynucleotide phosphatase/kinase
LPIVFLAATHADHYKKPALGMWNYFMKNLNGDVKVDMKRSFFCGDAAGRKANN